MTDIEIPPNDTVQSVLEKEMGYRVNAIERLKHGVPAGTSRRNKDGETVDLVIPGGTI